MKPLRHQQSANSGRVRLSCGKTKLPSRRPRAGWSATWPLLQGKSSPSFPKLPRPASACACVSTHTSGVSVERSSPASRAAPPSASWSTGVGSLVRSSLARMSTTRSRAGSAWRRNRILHLSANLRSGSGMSPRRQTSSPASSWTCSLRCAFLLDTACQAPAFRVPAPTPKQRQFLQRDNAAS